MQPVVKPRRPSCRKMQLRRAPNRSGWRAARERRPPASSPGGGRHRCAARSERRVPHTRPDDADHRGPGREGITSELGRPSPAPPSAGCADRRSAFPCQRVRSHGGLRPRRAPSGSTFIPGGACRRTRSWACPGGGSSLTPFFVACALPAAPPPGELGLAALDAHPGFHHRLLALGSIQRRMTVSSTGRVTGPFSSTASWKARTSKASPSSASARARSSRSLSSPIL